MERENDCCLGVLTPDDYQRLKQALEKRLTSAISRDKGGGGKGEGDQGRDIEVVLLLIASPSCFDGLMMNETHFGVARGTAELGAGGQTGMSW